MRWMMLALALVSAAPALAEEAARKITVSGVGEVAAAPDMAVIRLGVLEEAREAGTAMRRVGEVAGEMLSAIEAAGIAPRDVQTSALSLHPIWSDYDDNAPRRVTGFEAETELTVRVRDLDALGPVMDSVLEVGANLFRGLSFGLEDPTPVADEARKLAVADAARKAALYAGAAGVTLGPILSIDEGRVSAPMPMMERAVLASPAPVPVAEGEVTTSASVTLVYEIRDE